MSKAIILVLATLFLAGLTLIGWAEAGAYGAGVALASGSIIAFFVLGIMGVFDE